VAARTSFEQLLKTIDYAPIKPTRSVAVAVGDDRFDKKHPDFAPDTITDIHAEPLEPPPAPPVPDGEVAPSAPPDESAEPVVWRDRTPADHGTAVACLIAGRTRPYSALKGLTNVKIAALTSKNLDATEFAQDIDAALLAMPTTVVNLSLATLSQPLRLVLTIEQAEGLALFVVAAPDLAPSKLLCRGLDRYYPACWAEDHENVIVVGGTTLDGKSLFSQTPSGSAVSLLAPAEGYFAAGVTKGYVPVLGTSFATPLVAAAAAMVSGLGIDSPKLIKQRLIATGTVLTLPGLPPWPRLLNVRRATSNIHHSVLTDLSTGAEQVVDLTRLNQPISFQDATTNKPILTFIRDLRRLTRSQADKTKFHLAYIDSNEKLAIHTVKAPAGAWTFCYQPLNDEGDAGAEQCGDLAEYKDYVGPIRY
jgi:hypothetical protein